MKFYARNSSIRRTASLNRSVRVAPPASGRACELQAPPSQEPHGEGMVQEATKSAR
jgi:hypothetical protein